MPYASTSFESAAATRPVVECSYALLGVLRVAIHPLTALPAVSSRVIPSAAPQVSDCLYVGYLVPRPPPVPIPLLYGEGTSLTSVGLWLGRPLAAVRASGGG